MAAVSLSMGGDPCLMNDSMIFSLLDRSWFLPSVLNSSTALLSVPSSVESSSTVGVETEVTLRSSDDGARLRHSFEKSEMRSVFELFDENADGLISGEELRRWFTKCCGKDMSTSAVDAMISCVDRNNDGAVDVEEFLTLYQTHFSPVEEQDDKSSRGFHIEDEDEADLLLEAFRVFDRNHDGFISAEELQAVLISLGMPEGKNLVSCEKMIRKVDRNGDGQCDILEFQEMMSAQTSR